MKKVLVELKVMVELEFDQYTLTEDTITQAINEMEYSFDTFEKYYDVTDYEITDMSWEIK